MGDTTVSAEIAYYYPEPYWLAGEGGWVKSLLLFFDEVAILLPEYMRGGTSSLIPRSLGRSKSLASFASSSPRRS